MNPPEDKSRTHDDYGQPLHPSDAFRIGQLEGAIMGAIPYFEEALTEWERTLSGSEMWGTKDANQVITNLKALIKL